MSRILQSKMVRRLLVYPTLVFLAGYAWFQYKFPTCSFRYRLTAEVMTPDGPKSGSNVIEVSYSHNADWGGGQSADLNMTGEAVHVDLGQGKNLFVSLTADYSVRRKGFLGRSDFNTFQGALDGFELPLRVFDLDWIYGEERALCAAVRQIPEGQSYAASHMNLPTLLTFSDLSNPDSVAIVEPDEFERFFGTGVKLQRVQLALTQEAPTQTGMSVFPWWSEKVEDRKRAGFTGVGQALIINLLDSAFRRPGIFDNNQ